MTRRPKTSLVASPVLVGAVTVLVVVIAVALAYNANNGLPFAPSLELRVQAENGAALTKGSEVREGGVRIGFVRRLRTTRLENGRAAAELDVRLDGNAAGDLPVDTTFVIRPRSPLGLKYLEMVRGSSGRYARDGHVFPPSQTGIPVQIDEAAEIYDGRTRTAIQDNLHGFGNALSGRGMAVNRALENLPRLFREVAPVARNLSDERTRIGRFFRELGDAARVIAPIADVQADLFTRTALTFEAISADPEALKETISRSHPTFQAGIESFPVQRPFLTDSAALAREMQPVARDLRPTLPVINDALETGIPVTRRSVHFYGDLEPTFESLRELMRDPATGIALRALTANVTALQPTIRFLGPYQTVCNYWNYFWTYLAEHVSQRGPYGFAQRAAIKSTGQQNNNPSSMGSAEPGNGEGYNPASAPRGDPVHFHGQSYQPAITETGEADCETGQRGYVRRLARFSPQRFQIVSDPEIPGAQGPTYTGRPRVPRGQTFTRRPITGAQLER
ncbi:MAG TPA: MlaD family protein [Thermoleophilaceae bacterium]|nr:MlaD family protein [Thermoleophilaceae bacterium]